MQRLRFLTSEKESIVRCQLSVGKILSMHPIKRPALEFYLSLNIVFGICQTEMQLTTDYGRRATP